MGVKSAIRTVNTSKAEFLEHLLYSPLAKMKDKNATSLAEYKTTGLVENVQKATGLAAHANTATGLAMHENSATGLATHLSDEDAMLPGAKRNTSSPLSDNRSSQQDTPTLGRVNQIRVQRRAVHHRRSSTKSRRSVRNLATSTQRRTANITGNLFVKDINYSIGRKLHIPCFIKFKNS